MLIDSGELLDQVLAARIARRPHGGIADTTPIIITPTPDALG
jgi:hypothetical protein